MCMNYEGQKAAQKATLINKGASPGLMQLGLKKQFPRCELATGMLFARAAAPSCIMVIHCI